MKDVWAITRRIMSRLLARLRRRMALTAAFQSNQNDRVTLERRREDIFLASRSHRDAVFFFFLPDTPAFTLFIWFESCSDAGHMAAWFLQGCLFCGGAERTRRRGASPPREQTRDWLLHITRSSLTSLSLCFFFVQAASIKCCSLPAGWWEERSTQLLKVTSRRCFCDACCSLNCRMKRALFLPFVLIAAWCCLSAKRHRCSVSNKVARFCERKKDGRLEAGMVGVARPKQHVGAHFAVKNPNVHCSWLAIRLFHILAPGQYLVLCGT